MQQQTNGGNGGLVPKNIPKFFKRGHFNGRKQALLLKLLYQNFLIKR